MHGYSLTRTSLRKKIREVLDGQFYLITLKLKKEYLRSFMEISSDEELRALLKKLGTKEEEPLAYRGKIAKIELAPSKRELIIECEWLCIQGKGLDQFGDSVPKWFLVPKTPGCVQYVKVRVTGGYFPKKGERIKAWTTLNVFSSVDYLRLYKPGDTDNLVRNGDEFVCPARKFKR